MVTRQFLELLNADFNYPFNVIDDGNINIIVGKDTSGNNAYSTLISDSYDRIIYNKKWLQRCTICPSVDSNTPAVDDYTIDRIALMTANATLEKMYTNGQIKLQFTGTIEATSDITINKVGVFTSTHYWSNGEVNSEEMIIESLLDEPIELQTGESYTINVVEVIENV